MRNSPAPPAVSVRPVTVARRPTSVLQKMKRDEREREKEEEYSPAVPAVLATPPTVSPTVFVAPERNPFVSSDHHVSMSGMFGCVLGRSAGVQERMICERSINIRYWVILNVQASLTAHTLIGGWESRLRTYRLPFPLWSKKVLMVLLVMSWFFRLWTLTFVCLMICLFVCYRIGLMRNMVISSDFELERD